MSVADSSPAPLNEALDDGRSARLYRRGVAQQWSITDLPWELGTSLPTAHRHPAARLLSQVLHGERASFEIIGQLLAVTPPGPAHSFLTSQRADEARHVAVFSRYIALLDEVQPPGDNLHQMTEAMLNLPTIQEKLVGMHILIEGMALELFHTLATDLPDPLLQILLRRVFLDESRHVAFGVNYTRQTLAGLDRESLSRVAREGGRYAVLSAGMIREEGPTAAALGLDLGTVQARALRVLFRRLGQVGLLV